VNASEDTRHLEDEDIPAKSSKTDASKKRNNSEAEDAGQSSSPPSTPLPNSGKEWKKAMKTEDVLSLVNSGFLHEKEMDLWCTTTGDPYLIEKNPDEIPMFARFVDRGLAHPASDFFQSSAQVLCYRVPQPQPQQNLSCLHFRPLLRSICGYQAPLGVVSEILPVEAATEQP
jgi:hypothetical protein